MNCPVCGERGYGGRCGKHKVDICSCCGMCKDTAMSAFVTCEHFRDTEVRKPVGFRK